MTQFLNAFEDLFKSIYELLASIVGTVVHVLSSIFGAILNFFSGILNLFTDVFKGVVDVVGGVGRFLLGNAFIIGICAAAYFIYTRKQQGKPVVKKTN